MPSFKEYQMMFNLTASTTAGFAGAFSSAQASITQLQSKIDALNSTQSKIDAYTRMQQAVENTKTKLQTLQRQYDNLKAAQDRAGGSDVDLQNKMLAKQLQIDKTSASLDQQTQKLNSMGSALEAAGVDTGNLANESASLQSQLSALKQEQENVADAASNSSQSFSDVANAMQELMVASGIKELLDKIGAALKECAEAAISFESSMASVKRTVGGDDSFIESLGESFKELSTHIPITTEELAAIATTAGQLGIAQSDVEDFATVMAMLATTTDLTADNAATMLAQFANITGTTEYEKLGSTVAALGDSTATTASKIVDMAQGMAAAGSQAGLSETDILGIAAAVGSLGIEAGSGSTAMSTLINTLYKATETGDKLEDFAAVAGMTADEFKQAWGEDAAGAMTAFITGLNDTERNGRSAIVVLDELGITNVRQTKAILGLASANDTLSSSIALANSAWEENTALSEKAAVMYGTTESKMTMLQNAANNVKIAVGDALTPAISAVAEALTPVIQAFANFVESNPEIVAGVAAIVAVFTGGAGLVAAVTAAQSAITLLMAAIPGIGPILAIAAGVAVVTGAIVALVTALSDASGGFEDLDAAYDEYMAQISQDQSTLDLIAEYRELTSALNEGGLSIEETAAKQERLEEVKQALIAASNGIITATDAESEAFANQVSVLESLTKAHQAELMANIYSNVTEQVKEYVKAVREGEAAQQMLNAAQEKQASISGNVASGVDGMNQKLHETVDALMAMTESDSFDWLSDDVQAKVSQIEDLLYAMTGEEYSFNNMLGLAATVDDVTASYKGMSEAMGDVNGEVAKYESEVASADQKQQDFLDNMVMLVQNGQSLSYVEGLLTEAFGDSADGAEKVAAAMEYINEQVTAATAANEAYAQSEEQVADSSQEALAKFQLIASQMEALGKEYQESYEAAFKNIDKQFDTFEVAPTIEINPDLQVGDMTEALQSQIEYIEQYTQLYQKAAEMGLDEGLLSSLADGSQESAEALAAIAEASQEEIEALNEAYQTSQQKKSEFANTVAEIETNFSDTMATLQAEMTSTIAEMDMSAEAAANARATLQAMADAAIAMVPTVQAAFAKIAAAAQAELDKIHMPDINVPGGGGGTDGAAATGTSNAHPGVYMVGEMGPELVMMNGGEQVFTAAETTAILANASRQAAGMPITANSSETGNQFVLTLSPSYNVRGNANSEELERMLRSHDSELIETVKQVLADMAVDRVRGAYA